MKLIECPRDAWQGHHLFIPTDKKIAYLNKLLQAGFDTLDFGSFVSAKAMPQVSDTATLIPKLDLSSTTTKLLSIVANERGAAEACSFDEVTCLGFPFSVSETFQIRNTSSTIEESLKRVEAIQALCRKNNKQLILYISMGFGNPYGDLWSPDVVLQWVKKIAELGVSTFSLSDTVGLAKKEDIQSLFEHLIAAYPDREFGAHFHTKPQEWKIKIETAYNAGCRRFDGALLGYGGCPMAQDDLVGNMPTEKLLDFAKAKGEVSDIDMKVFNEASAMFLDLIKN